MAKKNITSLLTGKYKYISLGHNCYFAMFIKSVLVRQETHFFDYIGSAMWGINELFQNDFVDFFNKENFEKMEIIQNIDINFMSNRKYYVRLLHDLKYSDFNNGFNSCMKKFLRRKERLYEILSNTNNIIFFRFEEPMQDRIIYPEHKTKFNIPEIEHIIFFSNLIKKKFPQINFAIVFFSISNDDYSDINNNIITININNYIPKLTCDNPQIIFGQILLDKYDIVNDFINNIFQ
jgi:hypothetical protein